MHETSYATAVIRVRAAAQGRPSVAAFDGDGTLWSGDVGEDFLHFLLEENAFTPAAARLFQEDAARHGVRARPTPRDTLSALFEAYTEGAFPEDRICGLIALAVAGRPTADVAAACEALVVARGVAGRLHAECVGILEECRALGVETVVVSASPRPVVVAAARLVGLGPHEVIAVTPHEAEGRVAPTLDEPIPYGEGKATRLRERLAGRDLVLAAGDNAFDMAMLSLAAIPLAIRPKARLRAIAGELPSLTILGPRPA